MSKCFSLFYLEFKRFFSKRHIVVLLIIVFILIYFLSSGIQDYFSTIKSLQDFSNLESALYKSLSTYEQYSILGVRMALTPTPTCVYFLNSSVFKDLIVRFNNVHRFIISTNISSKGLSPSNFSVPMDFSRFILIFLTLLAIYYGRGSPRDQDFLKLLSSITNPLRTKIILSLSRILLILLTLACFFGISLLVLSLYKIQLSSVDFSGISNYFLASILLVIFFYFIGEITRYIRLKPSIRDIILISIWFVSVWILPSVVSLSIDQEFNKLNSDYNAEYEKLKIVTDFEKEAIQKHGRFNRNNIESERSIVEGFWDNDRIEIEAIDEIQKKDLKNVIDRYKRLAIFLPTTFYQFTGNEVSSKGYNSFFNVYTLILDMKREFIRFYIDQVFYTEPVVIAPFIKEKDGHLIPAESYVPENFKAGVLVNFSYIFFLFIISFYLFNRKMFPLLRNRNACNDVAIELDKGKLTCMNNDFPEFVNQFLNVFFGKIKKFTGHISIDGVSIVSKKIKDFLYLPNVDHFPKDIKTMHLIKMFKKAMKLTGEEFNRLKTSAGEANLKKPFSELGRAKKTEILITLVGFGKCKVYILNDFGKGLTEKERNHLEDLTKNWKIEDSVVIEIISTGSTPVCNSDEAVSIKKDKRGNYKAVWQ